MKILIVGGVAGGATVAARLRRLSEKNQIIMVEKGEHISFANCGLPYYIGDVIKQEEALLVQSVEGMKGRFNVEARTYNEAISIDIENKKVQIKDLKKNETYFQSLDKLVLSCGAKPIRPKIKGI